MGKKLKSKDACKKNHHQKAILTIRRSIRIDIDIISNKKQRSKIIHQNQSQKYNNNINPSSKIFIPNKIITINTPKLIIKNNPLLIPKPKWMSSSTQKIKNSSERLDQEIIDYINYITPNSFSSLKRNYTIELLTHTIQKYNPSWQVTLYGSFSQNLSTVFSDIDIAIYNNKKFSYRDCFKLFEIMNILQKENFSEDIEFINARVPILRGTCAKTGINFDISFNKKTGIKAVDLVRNVVDNNIIIKQAVIFIKILLKINNLNETYTGGMCSFLVFHLVYYFYIVYHKKNNNNNCNNYIGNNNSNNSSLNVNANDTHINCKSAQFKDNKYNIFNNSEKNDNENISNNNGIFDIEDIRSNYSDFNTEESTICSSISDNRKNERLNNICDNKYNNRYNNDEVKIGDFLLNFLKFYGFEFDYKHFGFSVNEKNFGKTFEKINGYQESSISVESIEEEEIDIGIKCFKYYEIVELFQRTYFKIKMERDNNEFSVLKSLEFPENNTC